MLGLIPDGAEVHWAKSQTLEDIGLVQRLTEPGTFDALRPRLAVMDRATQAREMRRLVAAPDIMLGSVAAVTLDGTLVVASATGSQIGPYAAAAGRLVLVVGAQKIVADVDAAMRRIHEVVYPWELVSVRAKLGSTPGSRRSCWCMASGSPDGPRSCWCVRPSASDDRIPPEAALGVSYPKSPKHQMADPAIAARLRGATIDTLLDGAPAGSLGPRDSTLLGALFESQVALDVRVYAQALEARVAHLRLRNGDHEVDLIVERADQRVAAIEVKLTRAPSDADVRHLRWLQDRIGDDLLDAIVATTGTEAYRRRDGIAVVPAALLGP